MIFPSAGCASANTPTPAALAARAYEFNRRFTESDSLDGVPERRMNPPSERYDCHPCPGDCQFESKPPFARRPKDPLNISRLRGSMGGVQRGANHDDQIARLDFEDMSSSGQWRDDFTGRACDRRDCDSHGAN